MRCWAQKLCDEDIPDRKFKLDKYFSPLYENLENIQVIVLGRQVDWGPSRPVLLVHDLQKAHKFAGPSSFYPILGETCNNAVPFAPRKFFSFLLSWLRQCHLVIGHWIKKYNSVRYSIMQSTFVPPKLVILEVRIWCVAFLHRLWCLKSFVMPGKLSPLMSQGSVCNKSQSNKSWGLKTT